MSRITAIVLALAILGGQPLSAAVVWDAGSAMDFGWNTAANWDNDAVPTAADDVVFPTPVPNPGSLSNPQTINLSFPSVANSLAFNESYTLSGGDLALSTGTVNSGQVSVAAGKTATISSTLSGGPLIKQGAGLLKLTAANKYTGGTSLDAGTLLVADASALGAGVVTVSGPATLAASSNGYSVANDVVLNADTTFDLIALSGSIDLGGAARTVDVMGMGVTFSGTVHHGALTKAGNGTLTLGGANTYSGPTTISGGELQLNASGAVANTSGITVATGACLTLVGGITVDRPLSISGSHIFNSALHSKQGNNVWTGNVTLVADGAHLGADSGQSLTVTGVIDSGENPYGLVVNGRASSSIVSLAGANTYRGGTSVLRGILRLDEGDNRLPTSTVLWIGSSDFLAVAKVDLNGTNQTVAGLTSGTTASANWKITSAKPATLTIDGTAIATYNGVIEGAVSLVKAGSGTQTIGGTNSFTGSVTINGGTLGVVGHALGDGTTPLTFNGGTLRIDPSFSTFRPITFSSGANTLDCVGSAWLHGSLDGSTGFTKAGSGYLYFMGNSTTLSGPITITGGTIVAEHNNAFGSSTLTTAGVGGRVSIDPGIAIANDLVIDAVPGGNCVLIGAPSGSATYRGTMTVNVDAPVGSGHIAGGTGLILAGPLVQSGAATKIVIASGNVILNSAGVHSYSTLEIANGTTQLGVPGAIPPTAAVTLGTVASGAAVLNLNGFDQTLPRLNLLAGTPTVTTGAGTLTLNGDLAIASNNTATIDGRVVLNGNVVSTGNAAHVIRGTFDLGGLVRTFDIAGGSVTLSGAVVNGGIVKMNAGTLALAEASIGDVRITGGTLKAKPGASAVESIAARITVSGAALFKLDAGSVVSCDSLTTSSSTAVSMDSTNTLQPTQLKIGAGGLTLANATIAFNTSSSNAAGNKIVFTHPTGGLTSSGTSAINVNPGSYSNGPRVLDLGGAPRTFDVADTLTLGGVWSPEVTIHNGSIIKTGSGTLVFTKMEGNTYNGLTVNAGTVSFDSDDDLGTVTTPVTVDHSTLRYTGSTQYVPPTGRRYCIGADGATLENTNAVILFPYALLLGDGTLTKSGASVLQLVAAQSDFSGKFVVNEGVLDVRHAGALGSYDGPEAVTLNGGVLAVDSIALARNVRFGPGGGTINAANSPATAPTSILSGAVDFANPGAVTLSDFNSTTNPARAITLSGIVSGTGAIRVGLHSNATSSTPNTGVLTLTNTANDYSGAITVENSLTLVAAPAGGTGNVLGAAAIVLASGKLQLRDNGTGSHGVISYGNDVSVVAKQGTGGFTGVATIDVNRQGGSNIGNTFQLGSLSLAGQQLNLVAGNNYKLQFTGPSAFTGTGGTQIINLAYGMTLSLTGGLDAGNQAINLQGYGTLRLLGPVTNLSGFTISAGTLEVSSQPSGTGRTIALGTARVFAAGYAATQATLLDRITLSSGGVVALAADATFDPNFVVDALGNPAVFTGGLRLGGTANTTLTGRITPATSTVYLGGSGGTLTLASTNAVSGSANLDVGASGTALGTIVLAAANDFSGAVTVKDGMTLRIGHTASLGTGATPVVLNNSILQLTPSSDYSGVLRGIAITGSGTIDTNGATATLGPITTSATTDTFTKTGAGTLVLANDNWPTMPRGSLIVAGGALRIQHPKALGYTTTTVQNGGALELPGGITFTPPSSYPFAINGAGVAGGGAIRNIAGDNTFQGTITVGSDTAIMSDAGTLTLDASSSFYSLAGAGAVTIGGAGDIVIQGTTKHTITSMTKVGPGRLTFRGDPNQKGTLSIQAGTVELNLPNDGFRVDCDITVANGATLRAVTSALAYHNGVNVEGTLELCTTYNYVSYLMGNGVVTKATPGPATLSVGFTNGPATNTTFAGTIADGAGSLALTKTNVGVFTLAGASSYSGVTNVNAGTLLVNGSVTGQGAVTVAGGATLGGVGSLAGAVTISPLGTLNPGKDATPGNLTIDNTLTFTSTANAVFDVASASSYDKILGLKGATFAGTLTLNGVVNNTAFSLFNFAPGYSGAGSFSAINVGSYTSSFDAVTGVLTVGSPARHWTGGANPLDSNLGTAANWDGVLATGDSIVFGAAGTSKPTPVNETARTVASVTFATGGYMLASATGAEKLTVNGPVTANASATISAPLELAGTGGSVEANGGATLTISGNVSGTQGITKIGDGTVELTAASNSYTGDTLVTAGVLEVMAGVSTGAYDTTVGIDASKTATLITAHIRQDMLTINAGSRVQTTGAETSVVNFLQIANGSGGFTWEAGRGDATPANATGDGVSAVPEPATWLLTVMATLAALLRWRHRR